MGFLHLHSLPSRFLLLVFLRSLGHSFTSISAQFHCLYPLSLVCLLVLMHQHCLPIIVTDTLTYPHAPSPLLPSGPVHTPFIDICMPEPCIIDGARPGRAGFCVRSCDWIACIQVGAFILLPPSCRLQAACLRTSHRNQAPTSTQSSVMVRRRAIRAYINCASTLLPTGAPRPLSRREEGKTAGDLS